MREIINVWDTSIRTKDTKKTRIWPKPERINHHPLCNGRTGWLLAIWAIPAHFRKWDIGETVATYRFTKQMPIHVHIRGDCSCLSFSQSWHRWARSLQRQKPPTLPNTEGMSLRSLWSWAGLRGVWLWGTHLRFGQRCMDAHLRALLR